jgi:DNA ligase-1
MKEFATLITKLGVSTKTNEKLEALSYYFATADDADKVWVIALFSGRRPKRMISSGFLSLWCMEVADLPAWLFEECYHTVGDLAETIALLLPETNTNNTPDKSLSYFVDSFIKMEKAAEEIKKDFIISSWMQMNKDERFVFNKLLTGNFRIGVSQKMIVNALAKTVQLEPSVIAHRISGNWDPSTTSFKDLLSEQATNIDFSKPYPFYLAYAIDTDVKELGAESEWQAEWKWDGIRGQLIKRNNEIFVWSRGEELMTDKFPEYHSLRNLLPEGIVLDGEIIPSIDKKPLPFALLQTRIGRKNITKKHLQDAPIVFFAYDILEHQGEDIREWPLEKRRSLLEDIVTRLDHPVLLLSPVINFFSWEQLAAIRESSREMGAEGIMLKRKLSTY